MKEMKKRRNKLYTLSYFRKRLKESGFYSKVLIDKFSENDKRYWSISISDANIICTCSKYQDESGNKEVLFSFSDGQQKIKFNKTIKTESMDVIIELLENIINT